MKVQTFKDVREEGIRLRRELLVTAVEQLFSKNPGQDILLRKVAAEARVSVPVIYHYFNSFDDLLLHVLEKACHAICQEVKETLTEKQAHREKIASLFVDRLLNSGISLQIIRQMMAQGNKQGDLLDTISGLKKRALELLHDKHNKTTPDNDDSLFMDAVFALALGIILTRQEDLSKETEIVHGYIKRFGAHSNTLPVTGLHDLAA